MQPRRGHDVRRLSTCVLGVLVIGASAGAAPRVTAVDVRPGPLANALRELAREEGVEILFQDTLVHGRTTSALKGRMTVEQAIGSLLSGTDVGYQLTPDGVFVLVRRAAQPASDPGDGAISEVLVIGRRTQNADIRRTESDIQPYKVIGPRELATAPHDSLDQYFRDRLPSNAQAVSPSQNVRAGAANNSAVDLRGIGTQRTLVLVDGRRLPALPTQNFGFTQADLNAISMGAIERIETLTSTAGGIHGPSAIGGVINVVLKRDYRGADLAVDTGLSDRGDAGRLRLEGRIGFTPNDGRTNVMVSASYAAARPFTVGERDYAEQSNQYRLTNDPTRFYLGGQPVGGVLFGSFSTEPLKLTASLGGASLGSAFTFLPLDFRGDTKAAQAALVANAGRTTLAPAEGLGGADSSLLSTPRTRSLLVNVRHQASEHVEAFVDALYLDNRAEAALPRYFLSSLNPSNFSPFANSVNVIVPMSDLVQDGTSDTTAYRVTTGAIIRLPRQWQASADYTVGRSTLETDLRSQDVGTDFVGWGVGGRNGQPAANPFGDYAALRTALRTYLVDTSSHIRLANTLRDATLRAAGPLASLPGGPLTLTLMGESRREHIPQATRAAQTTLSKLTTLTYDRSQTVRSGYVELRAPLTPSQTGFLPTRGLELQLAARRDDVRLTVPENTGQTVTPPFSKRYSADVYTVGARVRPLRWLMLRASLATGQTPPNLEYLQQISIPLSTSATDPQRGNRSILADGPAVQVRGGSHKIGQEKGRTTSAGLVLNPSGDGPRLSIDVSRIDIRDEIVRFMGTLALAQENLYPERVDREPLSATDAALGYTAGRITAIYTGYGNDGRTTADTVDYQLDWTLPPTALGQGRLYGAATWQPTLKSKVQKGGPWVEHVGQWDTPARWKGNGGLAWTRGPLTVDLNAQYIGAFRTIRWALYPVFSDFSLAQGAKRIPARTYVDLTARRRFTPPASSPLRAFDVRVGVQNLFDTSPPIVADISQMGYDYHGDPRRRRFELMLAAKF